MQRTVRARETTKGRRAPACLIALAAILPIVVAVLPSSSAAATSSPLTVALVVSETGPLAASYTGAAGAFEARLDLQNAHGGVNGHQLVPLVLNDQTSPTAVATAVQEAISKGAIGIVANSAVFSNGAKYAQQAGVPVTGNSTDGPEWGEQPYTNMFPSDAGMTNPKYPVNTLYGKVLKELGGTVLGTYGYGIAPISIEATTTAARSFETVGGKVGVENTSVPFGSVDFTSDALVAKQHGVNALWPNLIDASNYALATAYAQAGIKLKAAVYPTGYDPGIIGSPTWSVVQGQYFETQFRPFDLPNAGTLQMAAALQKYAHFSKTQFPTFSQYESWMGADLMIQGLERAGTNPTSARVIKALRGIKAYNGDGILPVTIDYSTAFGQDPPQCRWLMEAQKKDFVPRSPNPVCGTDIPGTSAKTAS